MKIIGNESEQSILKEVGSRIKQYRISLNITQEELAGKCGTSSSTVVRIENGIDSKFSNYIKILNALGLVQNIDALIPQSQPYFKALYDKKPQRQRAKGRVSKAKPSWVWGEDK